jgi:hypothetical protein
LEKLNLNCQNGLLFIKPTRHPIIILARSSSFTCTSVEIEGVRVVYGKIAGKGIWNPYFYPRTASNLPHDF